MSKKRASKSKRRRDSQQPAAGGSGKEPRLTLITTPAPDAQPSGVRVRGTEADDKDDGGPITVPSARQAKLAAQDAKNAKEGQAPAPAKAGKAVSAEAQGPVSVEDHEEEARFFHEGHIQTPHAFAVAEDLDDLISEPVKSSPKMTPVARARRAHFSKYVKGAMVAASAILALAGIRAVMGHSDREPQAYAAGARDNDSIVEVRRAEPAMPATPATTVATTGGQVAPPANAINEAKLADIPPPPEPVAAAEPAAPVAAAAEAKTEVKAAPAAEAKPEVKAEATKVEAAPVVAAAAAAPVAPAAAPPAGGKTALQEKVDARQLLERGKAGGAIEAGERSVALDPTDGEAWLILGAAYQEKGNVKDARRAFQACTKQGKRGPVSECRAMLQ